MKFNLGALSDLLYEKDASTTDSATTAAQPTPTTPQVQARSAVAPTPIANGAVDPNRVTDFVTRFRAKLAQSPNASPIQAFLTIAESLTDAIPDEGGRFRAALKTLAKTQNISQQQLAAAFNAMLGVIDTEHGKYVNVIKAQTDKEVTTRETSIAGINDQIEQLSKQRDQLSTAVIEQRAEIGVMQTSLDTATQQVVAEINDSLNKLRIYSPTTASTATK